MSEGTLRAVQRLLDASGFGCVSDRLPEETTSPIDAVPFLLDHDPQVVVFDVSPPYQHLWKCFHALQATKSMTGRGLLLTTTNKQWLDRIAGGDSKAHDVGSPYGLREIVEAIKETSRKAGEAARRATDE